MHTQRNYDMQEEDRRLRNSLKYTCFLLIGARLIKFAFCGFWIGVVLHNNMCCSAGLLFMAIISLTLCLALCVSQSTRIS